LVEAHDGWQPFRLGHGTLATTSLAQSPAGRAKNAGRLPDVSAPAPTPSGPQFLLVFVRYSFEGGRWRRCAGTGRRPGGDATQSAKPCSRNAAQSGQSRSRRTGTSASRSTRSPTPGASALTRRLRVLVVTAMRSASNASASSRISLAG